jgi:hypothetical protein
MAADIRNALSKALEPISEDNARLVRDPLTEIEKYPEPFLKHYQIYRIQHFNPYKPVVFYVSFAPGRPAYMLTGKPENYVQLAFADSLAIDSPEMAISYVKAYLEVTRSMSGSFYLVSDATDVKFRPRLSSQEENSRATFLSKYRSLITAPTAKATNGTYQVTLYTVRNQSLESHTITVSRKGSIEDTVTTLEHNLPLVYGL